MAFFELRQYKVHPGKMGEWVRLMEEEILPFQIARGMVVTGSFTDVRNGMSKLGENRPGFANASGFIHLRCFAQHPAT